MRRSAIIIALLFMTLTPALAAAYAFLCYEGDECGVCLEDTAPRWSPPRPEFYFDYETLPETVTAEQWRKVIEETLYAFNSVGKTSLEIGQAGQALTRSYGAEEQMSEIFWITDKAEWIRETGIVTSSTLAASRVRYSCGEPRIIYDADIAINGAGRFDWRVNCEGLKRCRSVKHTLMHELGHSIGLGHPCEECDWALMAAQSESSQPEFLMKDDIEGIRALYPEGQGGDYDAASITDAESEQEALDGAEREEEDKNDGGGGGYYKLEEITEGGGCSCKMRRK